MNIATINNQVLKTQADSRQSFVKTQPTKNKDSSSISSVLPSAERLAKYTASASEQKDKEMKIRDSFSQLIKLLKPEITDFLACLSVCAQNISLRAAMASSGCDENTAQKYLNCLCRLSLLNASDTDNRFVFHPLIRLLVQELATSRALPEGAAARHAHFFIEFAKSHQSDRAVALVAEELNDLLLAARWLQQQGKIDCEFISSLKPCLEQYGYWQEAVELMTQFQLLAEQLEDWEAAVKYRIGQAKYLSLQGELSQAEDLLHLIPSLLCKIEEPSTRQVSEAKWLNSLSCTLRRQGRIEEAIEALQRAAAIEVHLDNQEGLAIVLNSLGTALRKAGRLDEAEAVLGRSYALHSGSDSQRSAAMVLHSLGNVLKEQGRLDEAANTLWRSHAISQALGDQLSLAMVLSSVGNLLQEQGYINEAIETLRQSLAIYEQLGDQRSVAVSLNRLGGVYQKHGRLSEAVDTFHKSVEVGKVLNSKKHNECLAGKLTSLGRVLKKQGRLEEALEVFQSSQELWEALGELRHLATTLADLGEIHQRLKRPDEAAIALQRSAAIGKQIGAQSSGSTPLRSGLARPILLKLKDKSSRPQHRHLRSS